MVEVMLGFFSLEGNPLLCMRELYCDVYVSEYCILREETVRKEEEVTTSVL
jgi:hypothetical protein